MRKPTKEEKLRYDTRTRETYATVKAVQEKLLAETGSWYGKGPGFHPEWEAAWAVYNEARNTCPSCGSTRSEVQNHDLMWHDGDVVCLDCDTRVRGYDAG